MGTAQPWSLRQLRVPVALENRHGCFVCGDRGDRLAEAGHVQFDRDWSLTGPRFKMPHATKQTARRLFVTCLVDLHRPSVGFAAIRLLEQAAFARSRCQRAQTLLRQPATIRVIVPRRRDWPRHFDAFGGYDYCGVPQVPARSAEQSHATSIRR